MAELERSLASKDRQNGSLANRARAYVATETRLLMDERGVNQRMAERLDRYGETVGLVRERIPKDGARTGVYLEDLAIRLDHTGDRIRDGDYRGAAREVRELASDHPEVFLGLAFAAGAFIGRIAREIMVERKQETTSSPAVPARSTDVGPNVPPVSGPSDFGGPTLQREG